MSGDIVERLRSQERIVLPAGTQIAIHGGTIETIQDIPMHLPAGDRLEAAAKIERLRASVAVLETALRYYADDAYNGYNADGACARAALKEAQL
jgi:hypothetical protein